MSLFAEAKKYIAGGVNSPVRAFAAVGGDPVFFKKADLLINAWRHGDIGFFEETMLAEMQQYPELYKTLVVDRNQAWVEKIKNLTTEADDYLVVVGALHLIGEDGVPALLSEIGIIADQLSEPES